MSTSQVPPVVTTIADSSQEAEQTSMKKFGQYCLEFGIPQTSSNLLSWDKNHNSSFLSSRYSDDELKLAGLLVKYAQLLSKYRPMLKAMGVKTSAEIRGMVDPQMAHKAMLKQFRNAIKKFIERGLTYQEYSSFENVSLFASSTKQ